MTRHQLNTRPTLKFAVLAVVPLMLIITEARGQQDSFRYAQPKAAPTVAKSARLHKDRTEVSIIDTWLVKQSSGPTIDHRDVTAIVEDIVLYSTGVMRWKFSIYNKGPAAKTFTFDFPRCYVVDEEGNAYQATSWERTPNQGTMTKLRLAAEAKTVFWIEYEAPPNETRQFKVGLILEGGYGTQSNAIAPFRVTLGDPLSRNGGKPEPAKAEANPEPASGLKLGETPKAERPGGITPEFERAAPPKATSEAARAVRSAPIEGRRYEGDVELNGSHSPMGFLFEARSKDRLLSAHLYWKRGPKRETKLVGAVFEDLSAPGGLVYRFEDPHEVEYLFKLDGNSLSGQDSEGRRYTFAFKKQ